MIRKTIVIVILLIAVAGCQVTMTPTDPQAAARAQAKKAETDTLERIRTMKIVQEESILIRDILLLKAEIAKIQAANTPPAKTDSKPAQQKIEVPELGIKGEFVPQDELPINVK